MIQLEKQRNGIALTACGEDDPRSRVAEVDAVLSSLVRGEWCGVSDGRQGNRKTHSGHNITHLSTRQHMFPELSC